MEVINENTVENKPADKILPSDLPKIEDKTSGKLFSTVVVLALIFGMIGAVIGNVYLTPLLKKTNAAGNISGGVTNVSVSEQSGVVDVVKQASPAVVSIIISEDLNKLQQNTSPFSLGPFSLDPFFQLGQGSSNNNSSNGSSTPNVQEIGGGSGFIISADGLIVTNKHVVDNTDATYTVLTNDGKSYDAKVLSRDPTNDIALVKIDATNLPTLKLDDSNNLQIGQTVIAIGNALGQYRNTVTTGVVSGIDRTITAGDETGSEQLEGAIQTDAAINPGNSGGPLLNIGGSVIGINTAIDQQGQSIGFALPVNDISKDLASYQKFGQIVKPFLGVRYVLVNDSVQKQYSLGVDYGAYVVGGGDISSPAVVAGSAADKAGIKEGDIILQVNNQKIDQDHSLAGELNNFNPGDIVSMQILSRGQTKTVNVTLGQSK